MRRPKNAGTTLIEILTVIVVFLVGILAIVQIFPPGLQVLRTTRGNTVANSLARSEVQRIQGQSIQVAEMIMPVSFIGGTTALIAVDSNVPPSELTVPLDSPGSGLIANDGRVMVAGNPVGYWSKVSGANIFSRVIGEGRPVPAPRQIGSHFGGLMQLMFAPIYYYPDSGTGVGRPGLLQVYGNDMVRRWGNRSVPGRENPNENNPRYRDWEFYFVSDEDSDDTYYPNEDQIWIGAVKVANVPYPHSYRVSFSFNYNNGGNYSQYDVIVLAEPADGTVAGNYFVVPIRQLISKAGVYGTPGFTAANYAGIDWSTLRVQRVYDEIPGVNAFAPTNPYQYKVLSVNLGTILINPAAFDYKVRTGQGTTVPLQARTDYTVYDWRIIRDEFRAPVGGMNTVKLIINGIKPLSSAGPDGLTNPGLGGTAGDNSLWTPDANFTIRSQDFILQDVDTGGIILGNSATIANSGYQVDKSQGVLTFRDLDNNNANGIQVLISLPTGIIATPWDTPQQITIDGRNLRALYAGNGEYAVQAMKAASYYRIVLPGTAGSLKAAEAYVGGSNGWGQPNRLYFPLADLGQKVTVGESWVSGGPEMVVEDQDFRITGREDFAGGSVAYAQLPAGMVFDFTRNGYAVRRVRGASLKVRVLWNPATFVLGSDQLENFNRFMRWAESWRKTETESFEAGGVN